MRTIRISPEVWEAIASRGKFGETPDDVLRRAFAIPQTRRRGGSRRGPRQTTQRMRARVEDQRLIVEFSHGPNRRFSLPALSDKPAIRKLRNEAVAFAHANRATLGQENAVKKALTEAGYHVAR